MFFRHLLDIHNVSEKVLSVYIYIVVFDMSIKRPEDDLIKCHPCPLETFFMYNYSKILKIFFFKSLKNKRQIALDFFTIKIFL